MQQISACQQFLKTGCPHGATTQMGFWATHNGGRPLLRKSVAVAVPVNKKSRVLVAVTRASYSSNNYGPVGGDARIKVVGVGGGGGNAVNRMISSGLQVNKIT